MKYEIPVSFFYRIHHVRPRFKNNVENVIIYVASLIAKTGVISKSKFREIMLEKLSEFPGNANLTKKTLENWRTEISALFGLYYEDEKNTFPSEIAIDLYKNQDLTKFFKCFLYSFQYPGCHIKKHEIKKFLNEKISFKPAKYFLHVVLELEKIQKGAGYLTKGEACHMIFNDKRASTDSELQNVRIISSQILKNREFKINYDLSGDIIRYAGDILDYMVLANLLKNYAGKFFLNKSEIRSINNFLKNNDYFNIDKDKITNTKFLEKFWVEYCSQSVKEKLFETDILNFFAEDEREYKKIQQRTEYIQSAEVPNYETKTKDIGDYGEHIVYGHECMYLRKNNRLDLIRWVQCIPNHFAVGYDIQSVDLSEVKKYIEVKTTISSKKLTFNKFYLTKNELSSAQTLKENYYIYRLQVIKGEKAEEKIVLKLKVIKNPIELFKQNLIDIDLSNGEVALKMYEGEDVSVLKWGLK